MADQDMEQQDFTEDYSGGGFQDQNGAENGEPASTQMEAVGEGGADSAADSGAADAPGRDDDRYGPHQGPQWHTELYKHCSYLAIILNQFNKVKVIFKKVQKEF